MAVTISTVRHALVAGAAGGLLMSGLVAVPAHAYPPGTTPRVSTDKTVYRPKKKIKASARNFQPRCLAIFIWQAKGAKGFQRRTKNATIGKKGRAKAQIKKGPKRKGTYTLKVKIRVKASRDIGRRCSAEQASTKYKVRPKQN